jgi:hypothetical protein
MKKALVAVAILAALGTAHAQFKIGGKLAYDIKRSDNTVTTMSPMDTSNINFTATESIGNGIRSGVGYKTGGNITKSWCSFATDMSRGVSGLWLWFGLCSCSYRWSLYDTSPRNKIVEVEK